MFYLLTNKQIIEVTEDTKDIVLQFDETTKDDGTTKRTRYLHWKQEDGIYNQSSLIGQVQESSADKYNLIEVGDLIIGTKCGDRYRDSEKDYESYPYIVTHVFNGINCVECNNAVYLDKTPKCIRKVFKLDQNGNYIRVI